MGTYVKGTGYVRNTGWSDVLTAIDCGECHIPFAIPSNLQYWAKKDGRWFYCPNGHHISYLRTENQDLRESNDRLQARLTAERDQHEATRRSLTAQRAATTRVRNRARAGVCPDCKRSFQNVVKHMETKHPELAKDRSGTSTTGEGREA